MATVLARVAWAWPAWLQSHSRTRHTVSPTHTPTGVEYYDVAIVGGGIVGLATAREILGRYQSKRVVVLEREAEVANGQTGHNSGVIHAGIHLNPGTLVSKCVVRGGKLMYKYCETFQLPCERVGKLICAPTAADAHHIDKLLKKGTANGVQGLEVLTAEQVRALEPNVVVHSALLSPNTGIADFGAVARRMARDICSVPDRATIKVQFEVKNMSKMESGGVLIEGCEPGQKGPTKRVAAANVITCAGLQADVVAKMSGGAPDPKLVAFRGSYYQMKPEYKSICKRNIYPTPSGGGIPVGVHFTPTVNERRGHAMLVGPGASVCFDREGYRMSDLSLSHLCYLASNGGLWKFASGNLDLALVEMYRDLNRTAFMDQARKLIPSVTDDMVEESFSGVMSQVLEPDGTPTADFIFERRALGGTTLNMRSTRTCTAAFALAEEIVQVAAEDFEWGPGIAKPNNDTPFWATEGALGGAVA
eukprot:m.211778 g.211778  ORF g.211778 m.211778 type:complete len:476 (+) comp25669_c0_seq1:188-1615(+)